MKSKKAMVKRGVLILFILVITLNLIYAGNITNSTNSTSQNEIINITVNEIIFETNTTIEENNSSNATITTPETINQTDNNIKINKILNNIPNNTSIITLNEINISNDSIFLDRVIEYKEGKKVLDPPREIIENIEKIGAISINQPFIYNVNNLEIGIQDISITSIKATNVKLNITGFTGRPDDAGDPKLKVYKYFDIDKENIINEEIKEAKIKFTISKNWLNKNGNIDDIKLQRWVNGNWENYNPVYLGESNGFHKFEAIVPGFSSFVTGVEVKHQQKISASYGNLTGSLADNGGFGKSIANLSDFDGDGNTDLVVGARCPSCGGGGKNLWILFLDNSNQVRHFQKINSTNGNTTGYLTQQFAGTGFGYSVANIGDLNGDGYIDLAVGAVNYYGSPPRHGTVWILFLNEGGIINSYNWFDDETNFSSSTLLDDVDEFGTSVANLGDLNGDGVTDIVVGTPRDDDGGTDRGAAYIIFLNENGNSTHVQKISSSEGNFTGDLSNGDEFGSSVTNLGDLDGDGNTDLAVGAKLDDDGGLDTGAMWILFLSSDGTLKHQQKISATEGNFNGVLGIQDHFGTSVTNMGDIDGNGDADLAVGSEWDDDGGWIRGAVWILYLNSSGLVNANIKISDTAGNFTGVLDDVDEFGTSVANLGDINGDGNTDLFVGAKQDDDGGSNKGAVWILHLGENITYPTDPSMDVSNDSIINWNYSGEFQVTETTNDFSQDLQSYLDNETLCPPTQDYCDIPLVFSSSSRGILNITNLSIQYTIVDSSVPNVYNITITPNPSNASESLKVQVNATDNVNLTYVNATLENTEIALFYNLTTGFYEGTLTAPSNEGNYLVNITSIDWQNLATTNITQLNVTSNNAELTLTIDDISFDPEDSISNTTLTINATIYNYGETAANNFNVTLLVDGVSEATNQLNAPTLSSNTTQFTWITNYDNHTITIFADSGLDITESNENNNQINKTILVLDGTPPQINSITADSVTENTELTFIVNASDNVNISIVTAEINNEIINLEYNTTTSLYKNSTTAPSNGTYDLTITATDTAGLTTSQETSVMIYSTQADLKLTATDILFSTLPILEGNDINITITVHNEGGTNTGNSNLEFLVDNALTESLNISVAPQTTNLTSLLWTSVYGLHNLSFRSDSLNQVTEANETNNNITIFVNVEDGDLPTIDQIILPDSIYESSDLRIQADATDNINISLVTADFDGNNYFLSYNSTSGYYENYTTAPANDGIYQLNITAVDINGLTSIRSQPVIINDGSADLTLDGSDINLMPRDPEEPELLEVEVNVRNEGGTDANNFVLRFSVNGNIEDKTISIPKASSTTATFNWTSVYSNHTITVTADQFGIITESNENNNVYTTDIFVMDIIPPEAPNITADPSDWTTQNTHTISWDAVTDTNGIDHYEYQIDYGAWTSVGTNTSFVTPAQSEGLHIVYVRAVDTPGNKGYKGNGSIKIDNSNPNTPILREWHTGKNWTKHDTPYYTWTDPGDIGSGVTTYYGDLDGQIITIGNSTYYNTTLSSGTHTLKVHAQDAIGNNGSWSNTVAVYIDITNSSEVAITSSTHPNSSLTYNIVTAEFNFTATDSHSGVQGFYYIADNNASTVPDTISLWTRNTTINITGISGVSMQNSGNNFTGLTDGTWYIHARAKDNVGNLGNTSHYKFNIDTTTNNANETLGRTAIETGINNSALTSYYLYNDQQIYVRYLNNLQLFGRFDRIVTSGNQTWAFNFRTGNESFTNLLNLDNYTLVIWEEQGLTSSEIETEVANLINQTKW